MRIVDAAGTASIPTTPTTFVHDSDIFALSFDVTISDSTATLQLSIVHAFSTRSVTLDGGGSLVPGTTATVRWAPTTDDLAPPPRFNDIVLDCNSPILPALHRRWHAGPERERLLVHSAPDEPTRDAVVLACHGSSRNDQCVRLRELPDGPRSARLRRRRRVRYYRFTLTI